MGIFDGWQFDPQSYQGGVQGLLAALGQQPMPQPQSAGAMSFPPLPGQQQDGPRDVVGSLGSSLPVPTFGQADPAQLPQNAQPAQFQPPQPQPESPGIGDRLMAGFQGFTNAAGPIQAIGNMVGGLANGSAPQNQTVKALIAKGFDPAIAQQVARDPAMMRAVMPALLGNTGQTDDIKEYTFAKREDPSLTFEKFMARKKSVSGEYGMSPIWGTGPDGKAAVGQLGKNGELKMSTLPSGFNISRDPIKVDGPTGTALLDPQTRMQIGFIPKDVAKAASDREQGEAQGQAIVNLPTTIATAENTLKTIKQLEDHPGKKNWGAFGWGAVLPDAPGGETRGFGALVDQVKGQNFLTAFQSLKGAGAITETEGAKAEKAQARLDRAQNEKDFDVALKDLKDVVMAGMERARKKAGVTVAPSSSPSNALKSKYGLD